VLAVYMPFCTPPVKPTMDPWDAPLQSLWRNPHDLEERDLFYGPWGREFAPDAADTYTLLERKHTGTNPGMTVRDSRGRRWSVKLAPADLSPPEGPIEVVLSRVLSAAGYHQPPVYFLPEFKLEDDWGTRTVPGGRFRLHEKTLKERGEWSWQQNPFVGMRPYEALLTILVMFNASDLKNSNNSLYEHKTEDGIERLYMVRDLGTALGEGGRLYPRRGVPELFEAHGFIAGVENGFVKFDYHGWHQELLTNRIHADSVAMACGLLSRLSDQQWRDAFRAGGFAPATADRYIRKLQANIALGRTVDDDAN
jgi:hypothetical protein